MSQSTVRQITTMNKEVYTMIALFVTTAASSGSIGMMWHIGAKVDIIERLQISVQAKQSDIAEKVAEYKSVISDAKSHMKRDKHYKQVDCK